MSYLVISDGQNYKIAYLIESFKTHYKVKILPDNQQKKIKLEQSLYKLETNDINVFLHQIEVIIPAIDIQLIWDMVDDYSKEISIFELTTLYFGESYTEIQLTSLLFVLSNQCLSFDNHQNGLFTKCSLEVQKTKKSLLDQQAKERKIFDDYYNKLINFQNPEFPESLNIINLINKPDKNSNEYKALNQAAKNLNIDSVELLHKIGIITNLPKYFVDSFISKNFSEGIHYVHNKNNKISYPIEDNAHLKVFSIDSKDTTEIDDAFSVTITDAGYIIGIHISAPALDNTLEDMVVHNISTIYYPGNKITMLSPDIINQYSLWERSSTSVVSIYFCTDKDYQIKEYYSKLENVIVDKNLRIEELELLFNLESLEQVNNCSYETELMILYNFANKLEEIRGRPSVNDLSIDYNFHFEGDKIIVASRIRGNPIDKLVSELMILANCTWGRMLTNSFIPAIYRVKQPNYPVKMTLQADSHTGLNVSYYTWATSPLRRATDYVNQRQILSLICNNKTHFTGTDYVLLQVVENFDKRYPKYVEFQSKLERYWSLKYLLQENISELYGTFIYKSKVQLVGVPIEFDSQGLITAKPKGSRIKVKILNINLVTLHFDFKIIEDKNSQEN